MRTPLISLRKNLNDRRSLPPSETNGGMDWFSAQPCKFATSRVNLQISSFFPRMLVGHTAKRRNNTGNGVFDRFRDFWQILRSSRNFRTKTGAACLMMTVSRLGTSNPDWLLISHKSTLCAFFPAVAPCVVFSLSQSSSYFLSFVFLILTLFSKPIFSFLVFKLEWLSNHPLKVRRALLLHLLIQLLDFLTN